jgi:hypothetical protein
VVVGVAVGDREPRVVLSTFLATGAEGDRLSLEPFHVAAEMARDGAGDAAAAVAEGRERQDRLAAKGLDDIIRKLRAATFEPVMAALLVNRAGWVTDLLSYSLAFAEHVPVAEGLAVRDALRFAFGRCEIDATEMDEKSLPEVASNEFGISSTEMDARLKALGAAAGRPWRKEQKLACLAAWIAASRDRQRGR